MKHIIETFEEPKLTEEEYRDAIRRKLKALTYEQNFIEQTINGWIKREIIISKDSLFFNEETSMHIVNFEWRGHAWYTNKGQQIIKSVKRMYNRLLMIHEKISDVEFVLNNIAKFHKARNTRLLNAKPKPLKENEQSSRSEKDEIKYVLHKIKSIAYETGFRGRNLHKSTKLKNRLVILNQMYTTYREKVNALLEQKQDEIFDKLGQVGWTMIIQNEEPALEYRYAIEWKKDYNPKNGACTQQQNFSCKTIGQALYVGITLAFPSTVEQFILHLFD